MKNSETHLKDVPQNRSHKEKGKNEDATHETRKNNRKHTEQGKRKFPGLEDAGSWNWEAASGEGCLGRSVPWLQPEAGAFLLGRGWRGLWIEQCCEALKRKLDLGLKGQLLVPGSAETSSTVCILEINTSRVSALCQTPWWALGCSYK